MKNSRRNEIKEMDFAHVSCPILFCKSSCSIAVEPQPLHTRIRKSNVDGYSINLRIPRLR